MEIDIKDNLDNVSSMDKVYRYLMTEILIEGLMLMEILKDKDSIIGKMVAILKDNSKID